MKETILAFIAEHGAWLAPIVFGLGLGESIILISFFIPSTVIFIALGALQSATGAALWPLVVAGAAGAFVGDALSYIAGRYFKADIMKLKPIRDYPDAYARTRIITRRWGVLAILGSKFMGMFRPIIPVVAGALAMPVPRFLFASALSSAAWAFVFLGSGYGLSWLTL